METTPIRDGPQTPAQAAGGRLALNHPVPSARPSPVVGETQEVETSRRRRRGTSILRLPEGHEAGFLWMNCQSVLCETLGDNFQHPTSIRLVREADHKVIREADQEGTSAKTRKHDLVKPLIQDVVQIHVSQDR